MAAHPDDDDAVEGGVGLPVAAAVEPVPVVLPRGGDRAGAAQFRERRLRADPLRVVARRGAASPRPCPRPSRGLEQCRRACFGQVSRWRVMGLDLGVEHEPAPRDGA